MEHAHSHGHGPGSSHGHEQPMTELLYTADFWDERYRSKDQIWSGEPNPVLVAVATDLPPGTALDVGCGEGADSIWLAAQGWRVTGTDISIVALERAAAAAATQTDVADRLVWEQGDLLTWEPPPARYDLVSAQFVHLPPGERESLHRRLAAAVAPGGTLLVVGHHPSDLETSIQRPNLPDLMVTAEVMAEVLDQAEWLIEASAPERETVDPDGNPVTIADAVLCAVRRH